MIGSVPHGSLMFSAWHILKYLEMAVARVVRLHLRAARNAAAVQCISPSRSVGRPRSNPARPPEEYGGDELPSRKAPGAGTARAAVAGGGNVQHSAGRMWFDSNVSVSLTEFSNYIHPPNHRP